MQVSPIVLGYGSQGTVVFEGCLHGRPVAVKRMMGHLYDIAKLEIDALIAADEVCPADSEIRDMLQCPESGPGA